MGKRRHAGSSRPGSLLKSLPESIKAELGIGVKSLNGSPASVKSPGSSPAKRAAAQFLTTQPPDEEVEFTGFTASGEVEEETLVEKEILGAADVSLTEIVNVPSIEPAPSATEKAAALDDSPVPKKRRKTDSNAPNGTSESVLGRWDASSLVPHYAHKSDFPAHLQKWFYRRHSLFSLYDQGCLLDDVGWYSVTPEKVADQIAERCRCDTVLDAFCGVGGNAIAFARTCERVIAVDNDPVRLALAQHNATIYGVRDRIDFILADYPTFVRSYLTLPPAKRKIDVVFLSPPWGGPEYIEGTAGPEDDADVHPAYHLESIEPLGGRELFRLSRKITRNVAYYLPRNVELGEVSALIALEAEEKVEVEEEWMGNRLTALTCYFGGLAEGQEDFFDAEEDES